MQYVSRTNSQSFAVFSYSKYQSMLFVSCLFRSLKKYIFSSFDGENYQSIESSKYRHAYTLGLANYKGKALITGCGYYNADCSFKTELFDLNTMKWFDGPDFPFGSK